MEPAAGSSSSHSGFFARFAVAAGAVGAVGIAALYYAASHPRDTHGGGGGAAMPPGGPAAAASAAATGSGASARSGPSPLPPIRDPFLEKLEKLCRKLEASSEEYDFDSASESASSNHPRLAVALNKSTQKLARVLRDVRLLSTSERRCRDKPIHVLHRIAMAKLLLLFHRSSEARLSSSTSSLTARTPEADAKERQVRYEDWERGWKFLEGREAEADAMQKRMQQAGLAVLSSSVAGFAVPTLRQQVDCILLEVASEMKDKQRMWHSLMRLLCIAEASTDGAASSSSAAASAAAAPHSILVSPATLAGLGRDSLFVAFAAAPILGCWLVTFQLGRRLFGERRSSGASADDSYEDFHQSALESPSNIDYAVVYEIATQKARKRILHDPTLQQRLGVDDVPESVLPFDEAGHATDAPVQAASPSLPIFIAAPTLASPITSAVASTTAAPSAADATSSLASLEWSEWEIRAYSTSVESVFSPDANLRKQLYDILSSQRGDLHEFPSGDPALAAAIQSPLNSPSSAGSCTSPDVTPPPNALIQARRIYRQGALFHSTGLFGQPIPVVGTLVDSPPQSLGAAPLLHFSMQGYCHVSPAAAGAASPEQEYTQLEFYSFQQQAQAPLSETSSAPPIAGTGTGQSSSSGSGSGSISSSIVEARHAQLLAIAPEDYSNVSSAIHSPMSQQFLAPATPATSPASPMGGHGSTHLFDSASFASLHMRHFDQAQADFSSPLLSPVSTPPLTASSVLTPLQRCAARLGSRVEIWQGSYRVIQNPTELSIGVHAETARPRIEVSYHISLVVERVNTPQDAPRNNDARGSD